MDTDNLIMFPDRGNESDDDNIMRRWTAAVHRDKLLRLCWDRPDLLWRSET